VKLELKSVKTSKLSSHETVCFQAVLWVNGKPAFWIENEGWGASNNVRKAPGTSCDVTLDEINAFCKTLRPPQVINGIELPHDLDMWVDLELIRREQTTRSKRLLSKHRIYRTKAGELMTCALTIPIERIMNRHPDCQIITEPSVLCGFLMEGVA